MTFLRHASRHVHQSMVDMLTAQLTTLGWASDQPPFGADPIQIITTRPFAGTRLSEHIGTTGTTVVISLGSELVPDQQELGGALASQDYPFFIDVFSDKEAIGLAVATDIKDILLGRLPGTHRFLTVVDQVSGTDVPDWQVEINDVERVSPEHDFPLQWFAVHATATAYFPEEVY